MPVQTTHLYEQKFRPMCNINLESSGSKTFQKIPMKTINFLQYLPVKQNKETNKFLNDMMS